MLSTTRTPAPSPTVTSQGLISDRAIRQNNSVIRQILSVVGDPSVLSLAGGLPPADALPVEALADAAERVAAAARTTPLGGAYQYGPTAGDPRLLDALRGNDLLPPGEAAIVTTGSQQALSLAAAALINPGDAVACAEPTYLGAVQALRPYRPRLIGMSSRTHDFDIETLADRLATGLQIKAAYVVSSFANPTGQSLSTTDRRRLVELSRRHGFLIIDDDPYARLRFDGSVEAPMATLGDTVLSVRSASKIVSPGLRIGWASGPGEVIDAMVRMKEGADLHTSSVSQGILAELLSVPGWLRGHLEGLRCLYGARASRFAEVLRSSCVRAGVEAHFDVPQGGMFIWPNFDGVDMDAVFPSALAHGVAVLPGSAFALTGERSPGAAEVAPDREGHARLCFVTLPEAEAEEAISRLVRALRQAVGPSGVGELRSSRAASSSG